MIYRFIKRFTDKIFDNVVKIKNKYYLSGKDLIELRKKIRLDVESIGLYLGDENKKVFNPSPALIEEISKVTDKKVFVNKKAEMLFVCGRDLFSKSVLKTNSKDGFVLVQNERDENLGYGKVVGNLSENNKIFIKNLLDKGIYLRKEMT